MNDYTHIDLFSGIGGFALAARWAGFRTVAFSEIDDYASAVLRKHWPGVPNLGDITKANFSPYAGATVLTGGFPCQPFSCAGKQRGKEDDRFLWPAMLEVIAAVQPTWIVGENVTGIIRMELDRVLSDLEGQGYSAFPLVIPAVAVDAKHRRDRVWIVANSGGRRLGGTGEGQIQLPLGAEAFGSGEAVADAESLRPQAGGVEVGREQGQSEPWCDGEAVSDTAEEQHKRDRAWKQKGIPESPDPCRWPAEPGVGRVAHGIPRRVDRIKGLGNAVVPQVAFEIIRGIAQIERMSH